MGAHGDWWGGACGHHRLCLFCRSGHVSVLLLPSGHLEHPLGRLYCCMSMVPQGDKQPASQDILTLMPNRSWGLGWGHPSCRATHLTSSRVGGLDCWVMVERSPWAVLPVFCFENKVEDPGQHFRWCFHTSCASQGLCEGDAAPNVLCWFSNEQ